MGWRWAGGGTRPGPPAVTAIAAAAAVCLDKIAHRAAVVSRTECRVYRGGTVPVAAALGPAAAGVCGLGYRPVPRPVCLPLLPHTCTPAAAAQQPACFTPGDSHRRPAAPCRGPPHRESRATPRRATPGRGRRRGRAGQGGTGRGGTHSRLPTMSNV